MLHQQVKIFQNFTIWIITIYQVLLTSLLCLVSLSEAGLLGAGSGDGSCAASPFRTSEAELAWPEGCPAWAACCTEYGYCHPRVSDTMYIMSDRGGHQEIHCLISEKLGGQDVP